MLEEMSATPPTSKVTEESSTPVQVAPAIDMERARRVSERLRSEFSTIVRKLPVEARTIAGMADELAVPRPGCQRLIRALRSRGSLIKSLTFYPGVRGLQQIVDAVRRYGIDESTTAGAEAAVRQLADLTSDFGGSQSRLNAALETMLEDSDAAPAANSASWDDRRDVFESSRRITKRSFDTQFAIYIYRPVKDNDALIHSVTAMGMIGMRCDANALPLCIVSSSAPSDEEHSHAVSALPGLSGLPISLMQDFSSDPPPSLTVHRQHDRMTILTESPVGETCDVVLARRFSEITHPAIDDPPHQFCWMLSEGPSRHLLMQVYMHRSMARVSIPSADAYFVGSRGVIGGMHKDDRGEDRVEMPAYRWFDRLPNGPRLEQLGTGLQHANHASYSRVGELTAELFRRHDWDPDEFVGVRSFVRYPVWGAQYLINFDFSNDDE